jgi:hypothetical protein
MNKNGNKMFKASFLYIFLLKASKRSDQRGVGKVANVGYCTGLWP